MTEPIQQIEQPFLPRYQVDSFIGEGAAARIYKVTDQRDGSVKAVKALRRQSNAEPSIVERFEDEFRILRRLHHPSLPEVHDYGFTQDGIRYIVMEYVEGVQLDQYFQNHPQDLWLLLYELCEVLSFIHDRDLLHFDLKPANILVKRTSAYGDEKPMVVLMDFGLSYRRDAGGERSLVGTPEYMAPEVIKGDGRLTRAADYYSLGITLYQLLTGATPFQGDINEVFQGHLRQEVRFHEEKTQFAELYPHVLGLVAKDINPRLEAFEEFRRAVVGRLRGEVQDLERIYGLSIVLSIGMIGKADAWETVAAWLIDASTLVDGNSENDVKSSRVLSIEGPSGSGKSYLIDRVIEQAAYSRTAIHRLGQDLEFGIRHRRPRLIGESIPITQDYSFDPQALIIDQYHAVWESLISTSYRHPVIVIVDDLESLQVEDHQFLEYFVKRLSIINNDERYANLYLIIASNNPRMNQTLTAGFPDIPSITSCVIHSLRRQDFKALIEHLRSTPVTDEDENELLGYFEQFGNSPGSAIAALRTAQLNGALSFSGTKWTFHAAQADDLSAQLAPLQSFYKELIRHSPETTQCFLEAICCHDGPITLDTLASATQLSTDDLMAAYKHLEKLRVLETIATGDGHMFTVSSSVVRSAIYEQMKTAVRRRYHFFFAALYQEQLDDLNSSIHDEYLPVAEHLAFQLQNVGRTRELASLQITILELLRDNKLLSRQRSFCLSVLLQLDQRSNSAFDAGTWLLRRYFIKHLIHACWSLSDFATIKSTIYRYFSNCYERIPIGLLIHYTLALVALGESRNALDVAAAIKNRFPFNNSQAHVIALLVEATVYTSTAQFAAALSILDSISGYQHLLGPYGRCRLYMSYTTVYDCTDIHNRTNPYIDRLESISKQYGFVNEYLASFSARFTQAIDNSLLRECKRIVNIGITFATKRKHYSRLIEWHFRASTVYYEEGSYDRAIRHVNKALRLSEKMGFVKRIPELMARIAMNYQSAGLYGNSITHIKHALKLWNNSWDANIGAVIYLFAFEIHIVANSRDADHYWIEARRYLETYKEVGRWSYYWHLTGLRHDQQGAPMLAYKQFRTARFLYEKRGIGDDAARAGIKEAFALLNMGKIAECRLLIHRLGILCRQLESSNIRVEYFALRLACHYLERSRPNVMRKWMSRCESEICHAKEVPVLLDVEKILIRVKLRLGDIDEAKRMFRSHIRRVKRIVSNMPNETYAEDYLSNEDEQLLRKEFRIATK